MTRRPAQEFLTEIALPYGGVDCLIWPFYRMPNGYGMINYNSYPRLITRVVCELTYGPPPTPKHEAAHSCGKGHEGCCNPRHLRWATSSENKQDQIKHGTYKRGMKSPLAKLTDAQVIEISELRGKVHQKALAERFGISVANVSRIQLGHGWQHLDRPIGVSRIHSHTTGAA